MNVMISPNKSWYLGEGGADRGGAEAAGGEKGQEGGEEQAVAGEEAGQKRAKETGERS